MVFHGFQKMTLLDFPGKVACTVFTGGCNFRCPFCHNARLVTELDPKSGIDSGEILSFLEKRRGLLDGVAITGGEPLLQRELPDFIRAVKAMGYAVKLDTNGAFPKRLEPLLAAHSVDYVAMDIKNTPAKYAQTCGLDSMDLEPIQKSAALLKNSGVDFEFRTTVVAGFHTVEDFDEIGRWIAGAPRYFLQSFTDSGNLIGENLSGVDKETMNEMARRAGQYLPTSVRGI